MAKLTGWTIVIGLATSSLIYGADGQGAGVMVAVACCLLMWRIVATIGLPELTRGTPQAPQRALDHEPVSGSV